MSCRLTDYGTSYWTDGCLPRPPPTHTHTINRLTLTAPSTDHRHLKRLSEILSECLPGFWQATGPNKLTLPPTLPTATAAKLQETMDGELLLIDAASCCAGCAVLFCAHALCYRCCAAFSCSSCDAMCAAAVTCNPHTAAVLCCAVPCAGAGSITRRLVDTYCQAVGTITQVGVLAAASGGRLGQALLVTTETQTGCMFNRAVRSGVKSPLVP
jgi:hypothetical protein